MTIVFADDDGHREEFTLRAGATGRAKRGVQQHESLVQDTAAGLAARGHVVPGRQGDGFDLAVEQGAHVEFVTVERAPTLGVPGHRPSERRLHSRLESAR